MSKSQQSEPNLHVSSEFSTLTSFTVVELPKTFSKTPIAFSLISSFGAQNSTAPFFLYLSLALVLPLYSRSG